MNESKLEQFNFIKEKWPEKLMDFLGVKSRQEREFKKKFPETPYFLEELTAWWVKNYLEQKEGDKYFMSGLGKTTENKEEYIEYLLTEIGLRFRSIYIDFANNGNSHSSCWEFSVRLRDVYNQFFKQTSISQRAFLISGRFHSSPHHWIAISENTSDVPEIETLAEKTIYDGTIDQFKDLYDLDKNNKSKISGLKLAVIGSESDLRSLYKWENVSPAPEKYFKEK